jgi:APA family basic amino acid/polyamine antiporter
VTATANPATLRRELGVFGASMMGLGAMIGTGIFVSVGIAAGAAGGAVIAAILLAAAVATCNALSSAQLAASHAVSGGTYEYGYRYLNHWLGFTAGWVFLCAKTASAATAALGFAGYFSHLFGLDPALRPALAAGAVVLFTALVLLGIRRTSRANTAIVAVTLVALGAFVAAGVPALVRSESDGIAELFTAASADGASGFFYATALMFVAYTGYARIATLGEEVVDPRRNIPRAIVVTLVVTAFLYVGVAAVALRAVGAEALADAAASDATPLEAAARALAVPGLWIVVAIGSVTAMLGVLLNLILGLSRVVLAMGRRGDLPPRFGRLSRDAEVPAAAVVAVGAAIALLTLAGSVETTWAFSAFTVLVYYAITNLAALRLSAQDRLYPRVLAGGGLAACLFLAWWVPLEIWLAGLALIGVGLAWHAAARR